MEVVEGEADGAASSAPVALTVLVPTAPATSLVPGELPGTDPVVEAKQVSAV